MSQAASSAASHGGDINETAPNNTVLYLVIGAVLLGVAWFFFRKK